jgi:hypothetical protein
MTYPTNGRSTRRSCTGFTAITAAIRRYSEPFGFQYEVVWILVSNPCRRRVSGEQNDEFMMSRKVLIGDSTGRTFERRKTGIHCWRLYLKRI